LNPFHIFRSLSTGILKKSNHIEKITIVFSVANLPFSITMRFMTTSNRKLRWGIIGAGNIAGAFARSLKHSKHGVLAGIGSRSLEKARQFAETHQIPHAWGSYEEAIASSEIDAFYLATPHPDHVQWGLAILAAGKHLLCEKPITLNYGETMALIAASHKYQRALAEAYMYRAHPQTAKVVELVRSGAIGNVQLIEASFSFGSGFHPDSRLWNNKLGGGGILDVGGYPVSYARLIAGAATGKPFLNPIKLTGHGILHPETGVDARAVATMQFENNILAQVSTGIDCAQRNDVTIYGDKGRIHITTPYTLVDPRLTERTITLQRYWDAPETIAVPEPAPVYALEADAFAEAVFAGKLEADFMTHADTVGNIQAQDLWRNAIGCVYHREHPENIGPNTFAGRPLQVSAPKPMPRGQIPGLTKPVSKLVMGCDNQFHISPAAAVWDDFFEAGGNAFDTAFIYGGGRMEVLLGHWMKQRGVREQSVVTVKGAHTPHCTPYHIQEQLKVSLERLQTDHADVYMMHRDNLDIPVGEFIDVLNQLKNEGKIRVFGGSNWTYKRIVEANTWAKKHGLQGFSVISNNFSLARMIDPVWAGCESANSPDFLDLLKQGEVALLPWSSQARGFFTDRAGPDKKDDAELVRCWYSDDNFKRRERAIELAKQKGVDPINIALAWVTSQPLPIFPLIGPRNIAELRSSLKSFDFELSAQELAWLNLA
jgi:predicted dehydrogenase/aryl-alcohol dehydrogenase-like predicted oxidoreductase